jgi:hypothetical protein
LSEHPWPYYLPSTRDDIVALGVISLNYGQLEAMFRALFALVTGMNEFQAAAIFHRIPNNIRLNVLEELPAKSELDTALRADVGYFMRGFSTCADNRNDIMHSFSGGTYTGSATTGQYGMVLSKFSKAGNKLEWYATTEALQRVADDTYAFMLYGAKVIGEIGVYQSILREPEETRRKWRGPSPDKPPLPARMNWHFLGDSIMPSPLPPPFLA